MFTKLRLLLPLIAITQLIIFFFYPVARTYAGVTCQPIYGGGQTCVTTGNVSINKTVLNPQGNTMVDNLSINDPKYQPNFIVTFQISVTNSGESSISRIQVRDIFPQYIDFSSGPGNFDSNTRTLSFEITNLAPAETRTFTILGKVVDQSLIPLNQGNVCVVNQAIATNMDNTSQSSQDNAQFCIEKIAPVTPTISTTSGFPVLSPAPITVTPPTGANPLILFSLVPIGIIGALLRKKSLNK